MSGEDRPGGRRAGRFPVWVAWRPAGGYGVAKPLGPGSPLWNGPPTGCFRVGREFQERELRRSWQHLWCVLPSGSALMGEQSRGVIATGM